MGWMCSWLAVKGVEPSKLFEALKVIPTGEEVEPWSGEESMSYRRLPSGWTVVYSDDFEWANPDRVRELSRLGLVVGCQLEDKVANTSIACAARDDVELWRVFHSLDPKDGPDHELTATGKLPKQFRNIRLEFDDRDQSEADYRHEIPIRTAQAVCGFNLEELTDDQANFTGLRPVAQSYRARRSFNFGELVFSAILGWIKWCLALLEWLDERVFKFMPHPIRNVLRLIAIGILFGGSWTIPILPFAYLIGLVRRSFE